MRTIQAKLLTIIAVGLFSAVAAFGQTSTLSGDIKGPDGKPLVGAQMRIDRTDIKNTYSVKTDKNGHFLYANLPTGVYTITLVVSGKDTVQMPDLHPKPGDNPPINIDLSKPTVAAAATAPLSSTDLAAREARKKAEEEAMAKDKALQELFDTGMKAKAAKSWDAAIDSLKKAAELAPKQHVVWGNLGDVYISRADTKKGAEQEADIKDSMNAYLQALQLTPENAVYHNNYARSLARAKKNDEAMAEVAKAAQLDPLQGGTFYYNMGTLYVNIGANDLSEQAFLKSIEIDPSFAEAYYQYGVVLMGKATIGKDNKISAPPGTAEAFQKYLALKPAGPDADAAKAMLDSMGATVKTTLDKKSKNGKVGAVFRALLYLLTMVIAITVVKSVIGIFSKAFTNAQDQAQPRPPGKAAPQTLQKDPVCGTFVAASTEFQISKGGNTYYFCSQECRDKF